MIAWIAPRRRPLRSQPLTLAALSWLGLTLIATALAPVVAPAGPLAVIPGAALEPPQPEYPLGTDGLGRDVLSRLLWGGRETLLIGGLGLSIAVGLGLTAGALAAQVGGWVEAGVMRLADALLSIPGLLLALTVTTLLAPGPTSIAIAVGVAAAPAYARIARSAILDVLAQPYIEAARAVGCSPWRITVRHVLPNAASPLIAFAATQLGWILLNGAALTFLGLGAPPGSPEWGAMLAEGRDYLRDGPWISTSPGLALTLTVLSANLIGDGLQESLPRA